MSNFIENIKKSITDSQMSMDMDVDMQTARVEYVITERDDITNPNSSIIAMLKGGSIPRLNSIYVTFAYTSKHIRTSGMSKIWVGPITPVMRTFTDVPCRGDDVLIIWIEKKAYYLGPLNSNNSVQYNPNKTVEAKIIRSAKSSIVKGKIKGKDLQGIPETVKYTDLARLEKPYSETMDYPETEVERDNMSKAQYIRTFGAPGDTYIEGRFGNSLRLGERNNGPLTILSNLRQKEGEVNDSNAALETPADGAVLAMFSEFTIQDSFLLTEPWLPSCNSDNNKNHPIVFSSTYKDNQMFISSDRIVIDSRESEGGGLTFSSFNDIEMGSNSNINIRAAKATWLDSSNVYLGKGTVKVNVDNDGNRTTERNPDAEPLVLGTQLKELLDKMVDAIGNLAVSGTIGGMSGPINSHPSYKGFEAIKNELKDILSTKHYIEKN